MDYTKVLEEKYPKHIIEYLRKRIGLEKDDTSLDGDFIDLSSAEVFREVLEWNGLLGGYDYTIKGWIKDIYGIDLDNLNGEDEE